MVNYEQILSARVKKGAAFGIRRFFELAAKMPHAISLGVGEPDFETPWRFRAAPAFSLWKKDRPSTPPTGVLPSCAIRLPRSCRKYRLCYDADKRSLVTVGGSEAIDNTIRAIVNVGDEVLIPEPSFVCYAQAADADGGRCSGAAADPRGGPVQADGGQSARRYYAAHSFSSCRTRTTRPARS